jgi:hypothetical protein
MADRRTRFRKNVAKVKTEAARDTKRLLDELKQLTPAEFLRLPAKTLASLPAAQYRDVVATIAPEITLSIPPSSQHVRAEATSWRNRWRALPTFGQTTVITAIVTTAIVMLAIASPLAWKWSLNQIDIARPQDRGLWPHCARLSPHTDGCIYYPTGDLDWAKVAEHLQISPQELYQENRHLPPQFIPKRAPLVIWRHRGRLSE